MYCCGRLCSRCERIRIAIRIRAARLSGSHEAPARGARIEERCCQGVATSLQPEDRKWARRREGLKLKRLPIIAGVLFALGKVCRWRPVSPRRPRSASPRSRSSDHPSYVAFDDLDVLIDLSQCGAGRPLQVGWCRIRRAARASGCLRVDRLATGALEPFDQPLPERAVAPSDSSSNDGGASPSATPAAGAHERSSLRADAFETPTPARWLGPGGRSPRNVGVFQAGKQSGTCYKPARL